MDPIGAFNFFQSRGWSPAQSAGIIGNLSVESGGWNHRAIGDGGRAFGLAQWHPDRQANFRNVFGIPIQRSTPEQQLQFVDWELRNTERGAGAALRSARTPTEASNIFARRYERPANSSSFGERARRSNSIMGGALDAGRNILGRAGDAAQQWAEDTIPGAGIIFGIRDSLLGWDSPIGSCGANPFCYLKQWIEESEFFQRLALAVLAFIVLFAAFYLMKGNNFSQVVNRVKGE